MRSVYTHIYGERLCAGAENKYSNVRRSIIYESKVPRTVHPYLPSLVFRKSEANGICRLLCVRVPIVYVPFCGGLDCCWQELLF